ncbi:ThuA domain-containing protein [Pendulispora rubella]|uniref:ThuA domain-containing protein n=1 Tax=Pendulispora rubella TaxID=2741070 RepID=A0ABZ2LAY6_9BACT
MRKTAPWISLWILCVLLGASPVYGQHEAAPAFKVLAFYNGNFDAGHIAFVREANPWFSQLASQNGFSYTATNNWNMLNANDLAQYQVVMFLDDLPQTSAQRSAFQQYMQNGGGFFGFHVSAFNTNPGGWSWYHNEFLGTGAFKSNTWGPTTAILRAEDRTHPSTTRLNATFTSSVSEWYAWNNDLRNNANIRILTSVDPSSFPLGTDPNQSWYSGYYPIMWTNRNYKMLYANFGHNAVGGSGQSTSSTFASEQQNRFILDGLLWLGGGGSPPPGGGPISSTAWYGVSNAGNAKCIDARGAASGNGTVIQQYACNDTYAQQFQFQPTSGGYVRINNRNNAAQVIDVTNVSTADNAPLQLWAYGNGNNQQWQPVDEGNGVYHFVNRNSSKCLTVPNASNADSVQLVQYACNGAASQSFRLTEKP